MKIKNVTDTKIEFDNGDVITYDHEDKKQRTEE